MFLSESLQMLTIGIKDYMLCQHILMEGQIEILTILVKTWTIIDAILELNLFNWSFQYMDQ